MARLSRPSCSSAPTPGQEVEPRAGHLGAALDVDGAEQLAELQVVLRRRSRSSGGVADLSQHDVVVLAAGRRAVLDDVGHRAGAARRAPARPRRAVGLGRLDLRPPAPWSGRAARPSRRPAPWRICLPSCFCSARSGLEASSSAARRRSSGASSASTTTSSSPRARWRRAQPVGVLTKRSQVNHSYKATDVRLAPAHALRPAAEAPERQARTLRPLRTRDTSDRPDRA